MQKCILNNIKNTIRLHEDQLGTWKNPVNERGSIKHCWLNNCVMITMDINTIKSMSWSHKDNYPSQNEPFEKAHTERWSILLLSVWLLEAKNCWKCHLQVEMSRSSCLKKPSLYISHALSYIKALCFSHRAALEQSMSAFVFSLQGSVWFWFIFLLLFIFSVWSAVSHSLLRACGHNAIVRL